MPVYIHNIETSLPDFSYSQDHLKERLQAIIAGTDRENRMIHHLFARSGIETRHSVVNDFRAKGSHTLFFNGQGASPGTQSRNETYIREGRKLFVETAGKLIRSSGIDPEEFTHLITVSCTGFYAPGPDFDIIKAHNLRADIERYHLGFMGCYAALPALKLAEQICRADKEACVMIVSTELCTIHFQANPKMDNLLSATVFADGSSGAVVSGSEPKGRAYRINGFASALTNSGADDMAWSIGDNGFNMVLSNYIPELLANGLGDFLAPVLKKLQLDSEDINHWAVHPGGRAILDKVENLLKLPSPSLEASRTVLARYGNMSSATILFVLNELLSQEFTTNGRTLAMAFGPGLTIESALLEKID